MARRRVTGDRAWILNAGTNTLTINLAGPVHATELVIQFDDIETDELLIARERSEWYFERMIVWFQVIWLPDTALVNEALYSVRLGTLPDDIEIAGTEVAFPNSDTLTPFQRVYQEELIQVYPSVKLVTVGENDQLSTTDTPGAIASAGYNRPSRVYKWDLNVKTRLTEASSIVFMHGPTTSNVAADDVYFLEWGFKGLLRRGK